MTELSVIISNLKGALELATNAAELISEKTPKDLEKPPPHKWEHGDVFRNTAGVTMIYIASLINPQKFIFCISGPCCCDHTIKEWLIEGKFLFNIKEKL